MDLRDILFSKLSKLPEDKQSEVMDFVEFLVRKNCDVPISDEENEWSNFSLSKALDGMEDEESPYTMEDIRVRYQ